MVYRRKELDNVTLEHVWIAAGKFLTAMQGRMGAFPNPTGIAIPAEAGLENGLDLLHQRMVHHSIPERRGTDESRFGGGDAEVRVGTGAVGLGL